MLFDVTREISILQSAHLYLLRLRLWSTSTRTANSIGSPLLYNKSHSSRRGSLFIAILFYLLADIQIIIQWLTPAIKYLLLFERLVRCAREIFLQRSVRCIKQVILVFAGRVSRSWISYSHRSHYHMVILLGLIITVDPLSCIFITEAISKGWLTCFLRGDLVWLFYIGSRNICLAIIILIWKLHHHSGDWGLRRSLHQIIALRHTARVLFSTLCQVRRSATIPDLLHFIIILPLQLLIPLFIQFLGVNVCRLLRGICCRHL